VFVQTGKVTTPEERALRVAAATHLYAVGMARGWMPEEPTMREQTVASFAVKYSRGHLDSARTAVNAWELFLQ